MLQKDAELHAEEDKRRRELVETKNQADALVHSTEKSLKELGDKVDAETRTNVENEVENVKKALESDDVDTIKTAVEALTAASHKLGDNVDDLKAGIESLTQASHKLAELMYAQAAQDNPDRGGGSPGDDDGDQQNPKNDKGDDDVVDADFEEVK